MTRVMIIDDEEPIRKVLNRLVAAEDREILEAGTAEEALERLATDPAAVAFIDVQMPGKGGLWLCTEIRRRHPTTAMILATGVPDVPPSTSMQAGITAYLVKPFVPHLVTRELTAAIKWHEAAVESGPRPEHSADAIQVWLDSML